MRKIAFIGVGNMAGAIIVGMLNSGAVNHGHLILSDTLPEKCAPYVEKGAVMAASPAEAAEKADCVVLSVKPQNFPEILPVLSEVEGIEHKLIITIAAGISSETVKTALRGAPVVRVLPNTPMLVGLGVSVICRAEDVSPEDFAFVCSVFEASGSITVIDESDMNRIISVTGSSPAYVFAFIDAICEGAKAQGLDGDALMESVCDMVIGSATLLRDGGLTPEEQIKRVTSKGGTTERAMNVLYERNMTAMVVDAMKACTARAEEMSAASKR
jgi:pyrroline-5-carboxylate reductase